MTLKHTIEATWFDTCYPDYVSDFSGIVVGVMRGGQTRQELIDEVADEAYSAEDFPLGDHAFDLLKRAIAEAIGEQPATWRFWPVDDTATEITDPDAEIPDEQPSAWFRVRVSSEPITVHLDNQGGDSHTYGNVVVTCGEGRKSDLDHIDGSTWDWAGSDWYTILTDRPSLVAELQAEGWEVDCSCYCEPSAEDMARWLATAEKES